MDEVLLTNEIVDDLKKKDKKGVIIKLDFEKAYDKVCWNFFLDVMEKMGIGKKN